MACNCGLPCCFVGLKRPDTLVNSATHFCWIKSRTQLPWGAEGDDIPEKCLCAICFVRCFDGHSDDFCCVPPPSNVCKLFLGFSVKFIGTDSARIHPCKSSNAIIAMITCVSCITTYSIIAIIFVSLMNYLHWPLTAHKFIQSSWNLSDPRGQTL